MWSISVKQIIQYLLANGFAPEFKGDENILVNGFSSIKNYKQGNITWVKSEEFIKDYVGIENIQLIIAEKGIETHNQNTIYVSHGKKAFFDILHEFFSIKRKPVDHKQTSYISPDASIGNNVQIGYNCFICDEVVIEDNVIIDNNVSIESRAHIGRGSHIFSGAMIGGAGFGFTKDENGENHRVEHFGGVWIGENVEIGMSCIVDRGTIDDTYIGNNVKIDCLKHIPHNVVIGDRSIILGSIGGSCIIGEDSYIAPLTFVKNQIKVGKCCMVNIGTILTQNLPDGMIAYKDRIIKLDYRKILNL